MTGNVSLGDCEYFQPHMTVYGPALSLFSTVNPKGTTFELPYILTFVVHQGDEWKPPARISGLMKRPASAPRALLDSLQEMELDMGYIPVTVPKHHPENLKGHILGRVTLALMSAALENRCVEFLNDHADMIDELLREDESLGMLKTLLRYTFQVDNESWKQHDNVVKQIKSQIVKENVMSIAEQLKIEGRNEGRKEGREEGRIDLVCQLLEDRVGKLPKSTRSRIETLSPDLLLQLLKINHTLAKMSELDEWLEKNRPK